MAIALARPTDLGYPDRIAGMAAALLGGFLLALALGGMAAGDLAGGDAAPGGGGRPGLAPGVPVAADRVFYAGAGHGTAFTDAILLSDGTILVSGAATDLGWLPAGTPTIALGSAGNGWAFPTATGRHALEQGFVLHLSADLGTVLHALALPKGRGGGVLAIKTTSAPGRATGRILLSGQWHEDERRYWIASLDGNFVDRAPSGLVWGYHKECIARGNFIPTQLWDVGGDGKVVFYAFASNDWAVIARLSADGAGLDRVPGWMSSHGHTTADGGEAHVLSTKPGSGDFRSRTWADYLAIQPDGPEGSIRRGSQPFDFFFSGPTIAPAAWTGGYSGYTARTTAAENFAVHIDRRTNDMYIGFNTQTVLPDGNPDFEPQVVAYDPDGRTRWWSRLYSEIGTGRGPFASRDGGATWMPMGTDLLLSTVRDVIQVGDSLYAASERSGVLISRAGGPWTVSMDGIAHPLLCSIATGRPGTLFVGGASGDIHRSRDGGGTWAAAQQGIPDSNAEVRALAVHPAAPDTVFAAIDGLGLFRSRDGGGSWARVDGIEERGMRHVVIHPRDPQLVLAASARSVWRSEDGGDSWVASDEGLKVGGGEITSLVGDPDDVLVFYATSDGGRHGVHRSVDCGATWEPEAVGNARITHLAVLAGVAYATSADRGVYKRVADQDGNAWSWLGRNPGLDGMSWNYRRIVADARTGTVTVFGEGAGNTSTPDQYVDGLAIDYSAPPEQTDLVVLARCHGNNTTNFWTSPGAYQPRFTGTRGDEHIGWLGRLRAADGRFRAGTLVAGWDPWSDNWGAPSKDPNLDGWPDGSGGNPAVKSTGLRGLAVDSTGRPLVVGTSRMMATTARAFQKMSRPPAKTPWHEFVRLYAPDLSTLAYSSAMTGAGWDPATGEAGGDTSLQAVLPLAGGLLAVGWHTGTGNATPTANPPAWGGTTIQGRTALITLLKTE
jgi:hypothetical protein